MTTADENGLHRIVVVQAGIVQIGLGAGYKMGRADGTICRKVAKNAVRNAGEYDMQMKPRRVKEIREGY